MTKFDEQSDLEKAAARAWGQNPELCRKMSKGKSQKRRGKNKKTLPIEQHRTDLIARMTSAEKTMQSILDEIGVQYEFQKIVAGQFIVDFYLTDYHVVCEVDGNYHETLKQQIKDLEREKIILERKYVAKIVRLTNDEILQDLTRKQIFIRIFPEFYNID